MIEYISKYIRDGEKILNTETGEVEKFDSINKAKRESSHIQWRDGDCRKYGHKNAALGNAANNVLAVGDI